MTHKFVRLHGEIFKCSNCSKVVKCEIGGIPEDQIKETENIFRSDGTSYIPAILHPYVMEFYLDNGSLDTSCNVH